MLSSTNSAKRKLLNNLIRLICIFYSEKYREFWREVFQGDLQMTAAGVSEFCFYLGSYCVELFYEESGIGLLSKFDVFLEIVVLVELVVFQ